MVKGLYQEAAGSRGGIKDSLPEARVGDGHHKTDDGTRCIELSGITRSIAHLAKQRLVARSEGMALFARREVNARDLVDHVAQQIPAPHTVVDAPEDGADHISTIVTVGAGELAQIREESGPARGTRPDGV